MNVEAALDVDLGVGAEDEIDREDSPQQQVFAKGHAGQRLGLVNVERVGDTVCQDGVDLHVDLHVCEVHVHMVLWERQVEVEVDLWRREVFDIVNRFRKARAVFQIVHEDVCGVVGIGFDVVEYPFEAVFYLVQGGGDVDGAFGGDFCAGLACEVAFCACDGDC